MHPVIWELLQELQALYVTVSLGKIDKTIPGQQHSQREKHSSDEVTLAVIHWDEHSVWACCKSHMQNHISRCWDESQDFTALEMIAVEVNIG